MTARAAYASLRGAFTAAIRDVLPSVVEIRTRSGLGSGVVFDSSGDIVTNAHVVGQASAIAVPIARHLVDAGRATATRGAGLGVTTTSP